MAGMNGTQLYGLKRLAATLKMARHPQLKGLTLKQKLALNYVSRQSKLTRLGDEIYSNTFTPYYPSLAYDRFLAGLRALAQNRPTPLVTNFAVTAKCCCKCWHCSLADRSKKSELSLEELKKAIADVQDLGASVIGLTGGEPLLRDDLEDILASIGQRSMPIMFTTGFKLTRERVRSLKKAGLKIPVISLDHYKPEIHDHGRRTPGMFDYALKAIELFKSEGFYVAVSFVPNRDLADNRAEIFKVIDFFRDLGLNDMRLTSPILSGHLAGRPEELLTPANVRTIYDIQKKCTRTKGYPGVFAYDYFESKHFYGCGAGFNYMFIDSTGNVCPCDFTMISFGNLREKPLAEIWQETSRQFPTPGDACYANVISRKIAAIKPENWPLGLEDSKALLSEFPSHYPGRLPEFFRRLGIKD